MKKSVLKNLVAILLVTSVFKGYSATCTAIASGNFTLASTWSCGHVPIGTENITIPSGFTVTITSAIDLTTTNSNTFMSISGNLFFSGNASRLDLPSTATVTVNSGGTITTDVGNNSQKFKIGTNTIWTSNNGTVTGPTTATSSSSPLPIELVFFNAVLNNKIEVKLNWQTATESSNDYFEIERSLDGVTFEELHIIDSKSIDGNSLQALNYEIADLNPKKGINYYRLKQVDFNTKTSYSQIVSVDFNKAGDFSFNVFPNPNDGRTFDISLEGIENGDAVSITVYDVTGNESYSETLKISESENLNHSINLENKLSSGIYMVSATTDKSIFTKRLIIK